MNDRPRYSTAFVCAMPMELTPLAKRLKLQATTLGGGPAKVGMLDGQPVVALATGMGTKLASRGIARLLDSCEVGRVVVFGITGAVENETPIGTLILPEKVVDHATGREHVHHLLGPGTVAGVMWTTDVITPASALPALRAQGVVSLDMETATYAQACEARGVPWSVFRCISDRASDGTVDDEIFKLSNQDGTPNVGNVVRFFIRHPGAIPRMMRLAKGANLARTRAAAAAIAAVRAAR